MPSIQSIHKLLEEKKIPHEYRNTSNIVEHSTKGRTYVNSRHTGKLGKEIIIKMNGSVEIDEFGSYIKLDTSDSYYSFNTYQYARQLLDLLNMRGAIKNNG